MTPVSLDEVTTGDAVPGAAPHRISDKATKNVATVKFTPTGGTIRAWRITVGGNRKTGRLAGKRGLVTGLDVCGPQSFSLALPSGTQITEDVTFTEANDGGADGARSVAVNAMDDGGWL